MLSKKEKEKLMIEGYKKTAKLSLEICKEWEPTEKEVNRFLDEREKKRPCSHKS